MWYVYILRSEKDKNLYVGITNDLKKRVETHNAGRAYATRLRSRFSVIYYEAHTNKYDAAKRERFLKSGWGKDGSKEPSRIILVQKVRRIKGL